MPDGFLSQRAVSAGRGQRELGGVIEHHHGGGDETQGLDGLDTLSPHGRIIGIFHMRNKLRFLAALALVCALHAWPWRRTRPPAAPMLPARSPPAARSRRLIAPNASANRKGCLIQNPTTASEVLYVNVGSASPSTANSFSLAAGATFSCNAAGVTVSDTISVEAATTSHAFVATYQ